MSFNLRKIYSTYFFSNLDAIDSMQQKSATLVYDLSTMKGAVASHLEK